MILIQLANHVTLSVPPTLHKLGCHGNEVFQTFDIVAQWDTKDTKDVYKLTNTASDGGQVIRATI